MKSMRKTYVCDRDEPLLVTLPSELRVLDRLLEGRRTTGTVGG